MKISILEFKENHSSIGAVLFTIRKTSDTFSFGEFVGVVADNPEYKIKLKMFHCEIQNDHGAIAEEEALYKEIPMVKKVSAEDVEENY